MSHVRDTNSFWCCLGFGKKMLSAGIQTTWRLSKYIRNVMNTVWSSGILFKQRYQRVIWLQENTSIHIISNNRNQWIMHASIRVHQKLLLQVTTQDSWNLNEHLVPKYFPIPELTYNLFHWIFLMITNCQYFFHQSTAVPLFFGPPTSKPLYWKISFPPT